MNGLNRFRLIAAAVPAAVALGLLAGCGASAPARAQIDPSTLGFGTPACFDPSTVRNYELLDRETFVVYEFTGNPYLVQLEQSCPAAAVNLHLTLRSGSGRICGGAGDEVLMDQFGMPSGCRIQSVKALNEGEVYDLRVRYGIARPAADPADIELEIPSDAP